MKLLHTSHTAILKLLYYSSENKDNLLFQNSSNISQLKEEAVLSTQVR